MEKELKERMSVFQEEQKILKEQRIERNLNEILNNNSEEAIQFKEKLFKLTIENLSDEDIEKTAKQCIATWGKKDIKLSRKESIDILVATLFR